MTLFFPSGIDGPLKSQTIFSREKLVFGFYLIQSSLPEMIIMHHGNHAIDAQLTDNSLAYSSYLSAITHHVTETQT